MFVRSRMSKQVIYRKGGKAWVIKPHSVTLINDPSITARELKMYYGSKIDIISDEGAFKGSTEGRQPIKNVVKSKVEKPIVKKVEPKKIDEKSLDDILAQVNKELKEIDDNKKVDTAKNNEPEQETSVGSACDNVPENKDTVDDKVPAGDAGDNTETNKEKVQTKSTRTRRTSSAKGTTKRVSRKKATKKQV